MNSDYKTIVDTEVGMQLKEIVSAILRIESVDVEFEDDTNLYELGLESLNVVELLTQIEIVNDITIDVEDLSAELFTRFGTLVRFVQGKRDERA